MVCSNAFLTAGHFDNLRYSGAAYDSGGALIEQSRRQTDNHWKRIDPPTAKRPPFWSTNLGDTLYIGHFFPHFGHFLLETLPELYWARLYRDHSISMHLWRDTNNAVDPEGIAAFVHSRDVLGLGRNRFQYIGSRPARTTHLIAAKRGAPIEAKPSQFAPVVYREIADYSRRSVFDTPEKVYFSRRMFSANRSTNEAAVEQVFADLGFAIIYPERLLFNEQVAMAANAKVLAGLNGSAMHLGVFMGSGTRQIIIGRRGWTLQKAIADQIGVSLDLADFASALNDEQTPTDVPGLVDWLKENDV